MSIHSVIKVKAYQEIRFLLAERLSIHESEVPDELIAQTYDAFMLEQNLGLDKQTIVEQIESQGIANPDREGVLHGKATISFGRIREAIDRVAAAMLHMGLEPGLRVGVYVQNPIDRICAVLGVMRARGIVIIVDPFETAHQIKKQVDCANIKLVICEQDSAKRLELDLASTLLFDTLEKPMAIELPAYPDRDDDAYISMASGKEIIWTHAELLDRIAALQTAFELGEEETLALWQSDISDSWLCLALWPLIQGGKLLLPSQCASKAALVKCISEIQANVVYFDSQVFVNIAQSDETVPEGLRTILCGSEPIYQSVAEKMMSRSKADVYFCFAPAGFSLNFMPVKCKMGSGNVRLSLGTPRLGRAVLLDALGQEIEEGIVGEIHLRDGDQLVPTGFRAVMAFEGDYRWIENQDKSLAIIGQQIHDTNRILSALQLYPEVAAAAALVKTMASGCSEVVVYVVLSDERISSMDLYEKLQLNIPRAELQFNLVAVTSIPLDNGYVNEALLLKVPVISASQIERIEDKILLLPGVSSAETIAVPKNISDILNVHLSDILPEATVPMLIATTGEELLRGQTVSRNNLVSSKSRRAAFATGGELVITEGMPANLSVALQETAVRHPNKGLNFIDTDGGRSFLSYPDLLMRAKKVLGGLQSRGLKPGERVILQVDSMEGHFSAFWACILGGIIPATVAIAPTYQRENGVVAKLYHTWKLLERPLIMTTSSLKGSLKQMAELYAIEGLEMVSIEDLEREQRAAKIHEVKSDDIAFFQLTSGSTGAPKCIQETHEKIIRHICAAQQYNEYCSEDINLNWLQPDHVVPILTCHLKDVYLGCSQVHVRTDFILADPLRWLDLIQTHKVTHSWSPNFGFKIVSDALKSSKGKSWDLSSLKYLMNAGEQVTLPVVSEFLDQTQSFGISEKVMQPAFGMAEVCTCMTYCNNFSRDIHTLHIIKSSLHGSIEVTNESRAADVVSFISSGGPVRGVEIRIADAQNSILPEGVIGKFQIRGGVVMPGYLNNAEANNESFIEDGWFNTGDLGFMLNGELFITGREKELIIIYGANFYCHEIEEVAGQVEGILPTFVASCGVQDPSTGTESLAIFFVPLAEELSSQLQISQAIRSTVTSNLGIAPGFVIPLDKNKFLKTTSGKIQRDVMKKAFLNGQYDDILKQIDIALGNGNTLPNWFFRKRWVQCNLSYKNRNAAEVAFILGSSEGIGANLASLVRSNGGIAVLVEAGSEFVHLGDNHFQIDPKKPEHFDKVFAQMRVAPTHLIHAWQFDFDETLELGLYSLIRLLSAMDKSGSGSNPLNIMLLTRNAWDVSEAERSNPEAASMSGIIKSLVQERPDFRCMHLDFDETTALSAAQAAYQEISSGTTEIEVAFRNGKRMISKLINAEITSDTPQLPIVCGGNYLITGGTGGIGSLVAKMLIEQYKAKVLIVARSAVEEHSDFWGIMSQYTSEILFIQVDVANVQLLQAAVVQAEEYWQAPILGAFHFAGLMTDKSIAEESPESITEAIEGKVMGAKSLVEIFSARPESFLVLSSSVNGFFGGFRASAYSAANAFLDAIPSAVRHFYPNVYSIAWTQWEQIGMNRGSLHVELSKAKGFMSIAPVQGLASLLAILCQFRGSTIVGLNPAKRYVASRMSLPIEAIETLQCYYSGEIAPNTIMSNLSRSDLTDEFGTVFSFDIHWLEAIPFDEKGVLDRLALRRLATDQIAVSSHFQEPQSITEKKLALIWGETLRANKVGVSDNFFEMGGHSLLATQLISRIRLEFGIEILIDALFLNPTLGSLAGELDLTLQKSNLVQPSILLKRYSHMDQVPLSFAQERLWFLNQLSPGNPFYNIQQAIRIMGQLEWKDVEHAFRKLAERQAVLRTTFKVVDGTPFQVLNDINDFRTFDLKFIDLLGYPRTEADSKAQQVAHEESKRGFDLEEGPVFRCRLIRIDQDEHILVLTLHHIVADAWSISIIVREFLAIFNSVPLPELPIEYSDFSIWQREWLRGEELERQQQYWKNHLEGYSGTLEMKPDYSRPPLPSYKGETLPVRIPSDLVQELERLSQSLGVTSYMVLLSVFNILLMKYSDVDDIVVGMPIANRNRIEIEGLIGFFVNTLAIRTDLSGDPPFDELVARVKKSLLGAYAHQDMPFEKLVNELQLERKFDRQSLCQVVFVMQNVPDQDMKINGLDFEMLEISHDISKFDLTLSLNEIGGELVGSLEYSTDLFSRESMLRLISTWNRFIEVSLENPHQKLSDIMLQNENGDELIHSWDRSISLSGVSDQEFIRSLLKSSPSLISAAALTPVQRDLYLDYLRNNEGGQYGLAYTIELGTSIDSDQWKEAVLHAQDATPFLKSRFFSLNGTFYQCVDISINVNYQFIEGDDLTCIVTKQTNEPFDLFESAVRHLLFKNSSTGMYTAILVCHHLLLDAYSGHLFFNRVAEAYRTGTVLSGTEEQDVAFHSLVAGRNVSFDKTDTINYWVGATRDVYPLLQKPKVLPNEERIPRLEAIRLTPGHTEKIKQYCQENSVSIAVYFRSLVGVLLERFYQPENDFVIFDIRGGRKKHETEVIGCLYQVEPVVFAKEIFNNFDMSFCKMMTQLHNERRQLGNHKNISVLEQRQIMKREGMRFYTNFYNFPEIALDGNESRLMVHETYEVDEIHFIFEEYNNEIEIHLASDDSIYKSSNMLSRLAGLSEQILSGCDTISKFNIALDDEIRRINEVWNPPLAKESLDYNLLYLFSRQVKKNPEAIAVSFEGKGISYGELNIRANKLANYLIKKGISGNNLVGLLVNPSIEMIVCIIGILKTGGAYLPIDVKYPSERVSFMINDSEAKLLITESVFEDKVDSPTEVDMVFIDLEWSVIMDSSEVDSQVMIPSDHLAYVIYTSGSTGAPKGASLTHTNVVRLFTQTDQWFDFNSNDVWTLFHSIAFDFSVWEIWGALLYGGRLVVVNPFIARSPNEFHELLRKERVTVLNQTPSAFGQLVQADLAQTGSVELHLRYVIFGGEALNYMSLHQWTSRHGFIKPRLVNMYGITETTVHVTYKLIGEIDLQKGQVSNIGIPIPDLQVYILDKFGKFSPVGAVGELYVGGAGLARGYLNRPELTDERFIANFLNPRKSDRLYKTGDIGRWLLNGEIEYLGRSDQQVKIRGFRIELGEIEERLLRIKGIDEGVVVARTNAVSETELVAYLVSKSNLNASEIKNQLQQDLPEYMLPSAFVFLQALPLTNNGKLDRNALPEPVEIDRRSSSLFVQPSTEIQELMVHAWREVLGLQQIGIEDNFYDLGGHSLKLIQLQTKLNIMLEGKTRPISILELFQYPTIRALSNFVEIDAVPERTGDVATSKRVEKRKQLADKRRNPRGTSN